MQTHFLPRTLKVGVGTTVYWAVAPTKGLVIFAHGFGGRAVDTWAEFPTLLPDCAKCRGYDILFYGYDGCRTRALTSAASLFQLLNTLATDPTQLINPSLPTNVTRRPSTFRYSRICVVAHSLGAVVSRQAVLFAVQEGKQWSHIVRLMLFAPAHKGSDIVAMTGSILGMFRPFSENGVKALANFAYPVLKDLCRESETLERLERECLAELPKGIRRGSRHALIASPVILGSRDLIVEPALFGKDPTPIVMDGKSHTTVCKPSKSYVEPVNRLVGIL